MLRDWARLLHVSPGTLRNWTDRGLKYVVLGNRRVIDDADLVAFLREHPHFGRAEPALARLAELERDGTELRGQPAADDPQGPDEADRESLRRLRARVATLDEELAAARVEVDRLRQDRDVWRDRARAHRQSLRAQLDLEDRVDHG